MKLIGSRLERDIEASLRNSKEQIFNHDQYRPYLKELKKIDPFLKSAYIMHWIPEQGEDIYTFITDKKRIYVIEISRINSEEPAIVEELNFYEYKKNLKGKDINLKLIIALKLIEHDLN